MVVSPLACGRHHWRRKRRARSRESPSDEGANFSPRHENCFAMPEKVVSQCPKTRDWASLCLGELRRLFGMVPGAWVCVSRRSRILLESLLHDEWFHDRYDINVAWADRDIPERLLDFVGVGSVGATCGGARAGCRSGDQAKRRDRRRRSARSETTTSLFEYPVGVRGYRRRAIEFPPGIDRHRFGCGAFGNRDGPIRSRYPL